MKKPEKISLTFDFLVASIREVHDRFAAQAGKAVNISLSLRNWAIGYCIREYEQKGADRAAYGEKLLEKVAARLAQTGLKRVDARELRRYRLFCLSYPQIWETMTPKFKALLHSSGLPTIRKSLISGSTPGAVKKRETASPELLQPGKMLLERLSFSHFAELLTLDDPLTRAFYEIECIRGNWSVRELKRQIASLYYERSGLSKDKNKLAALVKAGAEKAESRLTIRDPYVFEFLGLKSKEVMAESDLEDALLDKLQDFLLEMGHGFCFEARQKRILIGSRHGFVDLVFYHRILKCHVLIEFKVDEFTHEHLGQLNTYVTWYKKHQMTKGDNPPVGILLCTQKDHALVEYALAGMDNKLFVSKYQLELPKREDMQRFVEEQMKKRLGGGE